MKRCLILLSGVLLAAAHCRAITQSVTQSVTYQVGDPDPSTLSFTVTNAAGEVGYQVISNVSWLSASAAYIISPANLAVNIHPAGLTPATYSGLITISSPGNITLYINIFLTVTPFQPISQLIISTTNMAFNVQSGATGAVPQTLTLSSSGAPLTYTVSGNSAGNWLSVIGSNPVVLPSGVFGWTGTTPGIVSVFVNPSGLLPGTYAGAIQFSSSQATNSQQTVSVSLTVGSTQFTVSPTALSFSYQQGSSIPPSQSIFASTPGSSTSFTASISSGSSWISTSASSSVTPANVFVSVNPTNLPVGSSTGSILIAAANGLTAQTIPVNILVTAPPMLQLSSNSITFQYQQGRAAPPPQTVSISSTSSPLTFSASTNSTWLSVIASSALTPASVTILINPAGLPVGTSNGSVLISTSGGPSQSISVNSIVSAAPAIQLSVSALSFQYTQGTLAPPSQTVTVLSTSDSLSFTTSTGNSWLLVRSNGSTTPAQLSIGIDPGGLTPGVYSGSVLVTAPLASNFSQAVPVSLVIAPVSPSVQSVVSAATLSKSALVPGQLATVFGTSLGPISGASGQVSSGVFGTSVGGTQVLFDGIPAPIFYAGMNQVNVSIPCALAGHPSTSMTVAHNGVSSVPVTLPLTSSAPGIFTTNGSGSGQGAVFNQDFSLNGPSNPAALGSVVVLYATGMPMSACSDGQISAGSNSITVIGGINNEGAQVLYAGQAPASVSGLQQVNLVVPMDSSTGPAIPLVLSAGGQFSPTGVTIAVK